MAVGYLKRAEAVEYTTKPSGVKGVAVGVPKEHHAYESFRQFKATCVNGSQH